LNTLINSNQNHNICGPGFIRQLITDFPREIFGFYAFGHARFPASMSWTITDVLNGYDPTHMFLKVGFLLIFSLNLDLLLLLLFCPQRLDPTHMFLKVGFLLIFSLNLDLLLFCSVPFLFFPLAVFLCCVVWALICVMCCLFCLSVFVFFFCQFCVVI